MEIYRVEQLGEVLSGIHFILNDRAEVLVVSLDCITEQIRMVLFECRCDGYSGYSVEQWSYIAGTLVWITDRLI